MKKHIIILVPLLCLMIQDQAGSETFKTEQNVNAVSIRNQGGNDKKLRKMPCPENCLSCTISGKCTICHSDYFLKGNKCIVCPDNAVCMGGRTFLCPNGQRTIDDLCTN